MWKDSVRNIVVIFQTNILRIVGFYVRHSAIEKVWNIEKIWNIAKFKKIKAKTTESEVFSMFQFLDGQAYCINSANWALEMFFFPFQMITTFGCRSKLWKSWIGVWTNLKQFRPIVPFLIWQLQRQENKLFFSLEMKVTELSMYLL